MYVCVVGIESSLKYSHLSVCLNICREKPRSVCECACVCVCVLLVRERIERSLKDSHLSVCLSVCLDACRRDKTQISVYVCVHGCGASRRMH